MGGPTVDAATVAACRHLGVPLSTVRVEVLDYGRLKRPFQAAELARVSVTERRGNEYGGLQAMQGIQEMPGMHWNREDARR
jgi:hypothetical protein